MEKILINSPYWLKTILINVYGYLLSNKRFSGSFKTWFNIYKDNLKKTPEEIQLEQFELLKNNLIYCYEKIPYYKKIFVQTAFNPYEMKSIKDIKKIPFLTKEIIRKEFDNLCNKDIPPSKYKMHTTSGSTGEKLKFLLPNELLYKKNTAFLYRFYDMWGIKPKDKRVTIGGRVFTRKPPYWIYNRFENQLLLSSHHLNNDNVGSYINKIESFKPAFIQGHPSAILVMAKNILSRNYQLKSSIRVVFTTGETLVEEDQETIEKAFNCPVAQQYGSGENCFSSQQVPNEKGYLINYEHGFIELIGNNTIKEVVVTSLQNDVMPFVRYKMNDHVRVIDSTNSTQFNLPILFDEVIGRTDDIIILENGNLILPVTIRMNVKPLLSQGTNYQLVQLAKDKFNLNLSDPEKKLNHKEFILLLQQLLGDDVEININFLDSLISSGGKVRNIIRQMQ